jgi:outer membrane lipoprotein-sorting protein
MNFVRRAMVRGLAAALGLMMLAVPAMAETPEETAARIQKHYKDIEAISANYTRQSSFAASGSIFKSKVAGGGWIAFAKPYSLRLDQREPRPELIVTTSQGIWWVREERKQAEIYPSEQFSTNLRPVWDSLGGLGSITDTFNLTTPTDEEIELEPDSIVLALEPKKARADLSRLVILFDSDTLLVIGFRIVNLIGDVTDYRFSNVEVNPKLPPWTFNYTPPSDFAILDHR